MHIHRKNLETHWAAKGEAILEPTTVNFPDIKGYTLLDYAIILGDIEKIETLVSQNAKSKKADALAKESENEFIVNNFTFTVPKSPSEETKSTPLMRALLSRNITDAKKLIDEGCDVNQLYENTQYTAMDSALDIGNFEAVQYLVEHGARLDFVDSDGANFISKAIRNEIIYAFVGMALFDLGSRLYRKLNAQTHNTLPNLPVLMPANPQLTPAFHANFEVNDAVLRVANNAPTHRLKYGR